MKYLFLEYVPAPHTIFKNTSKLPPASYLIWTENGVEVNTYWSPFHQEVTEKHRSEEEIVERMQFLLKQSVKRRLISDVLLAGCATPIGIRQGSPRDSYREAMANPLTEGVASNATNIELRRFDLAREYERDQAGVIANLHDKALHDDRGDILYALAELSYLYGERLEKSTEPAERELAPDYFLLTSIYAYLFLLDDRIEPPPTAFDTRARTACDLYNIALWRGMATGKAGALNLTAGVRKLPVGTLAITVDLTKFPWTFDAPRRGISRSAEAGLPPMLQLLASDSHQILKQLPIIVLFGVLSGCQAVGEIARTWFTDSKPYDSRTWRSGTNYVASKQVGWSCTGEPPSKVSVLA